MSSIKIEELEPLKQAYEIAKIKGKADDRQVAARYLTQNYTMISKILCGKNVSRPVMDGILRFIHDTDPSLIPPQYREESKLAAMETVGEI